MRCGAGGHRVNHRSIRQFGLRTRRMKYEKMQMSVRIDLDAFSQLTRDDTADRVRWVSRRGRYESPVSLSPRRLGVDFHRREGVPSSSTISTPSTQGPTERVLPVSPFEHRKCSSLITKCNTAAALGDVKKKEEKEGRARKRDSCRTLRNVSRVIPASGWLISQQQSCS